MLCGATAKLLLILRGVRRTPDDPVNGQYAQGVMGGDSVPGLREHPEQLGHRLVAKALTCLNTGAGCG